MCQLWDKPTEASFYVCNNIGKRHDKRKTNNLRPFYHLDTNSDEEWRNILRIYGWRVRVDIPTPGMSQTKIDYCADENQIIDVLVVYKRESKGMYYLIFIQILYYFP